MRLNWTLWRGPEALCAAALGVAALWAAPPPPKDAAPLEPSAFNEILVGEALWHGLWSDELARHMPLSGLPEAALLSHLPPRLGAFGQGLLHVAPYALTFQLGAHLSGSLPGGALALAAYAASRPEREPLLYRRQETRLHTALVLLLANALVLLARSPNLRQVWVAVLILGTSLLCRSTLLLFPIVLAAMRPLRGVSRRAWLALLVVPYLLLAPRAIMLWKETGRFIPFEGERPHNILAMGAAGAVVAVDGDYRSLAGIPEGAETLPWALAESARHPARTAKAVMNRLAFALGQHPLLAAAGAAGAWACRARPGGAWLAALTAYFFLVHSPLAVLPRYFIPIWPVLAALGAGGLVRLAGRQSTSQRPVNGALYWIFLPPGLGLGLAAVLACLAAAAGTGLTRRPDSWSRYLQGQAAMRRGEPAAALESFSKAAALSPHPEFAFAAAWARAATGKHPPAEMASLCADPRRRGLAQECLLKALRHLDLGEAAAAQACIERAARRSHSLFSGSAPAPSAGQREALWGLMRFDENLVQDLHRLINGWPRARRTTLAAQTAGLLRAIGAASPRAGPPDPAALESDLARLEARGAPRPEVAGIRKELANAGLAARRADSVLLAMAWAEVKIASASPPSDAPTAPRRRLAALLPRLESAGDVGLWLDAAWLAWRLQDRDLARRALAAAEETRLELTTFERRALEHQSQGKLEEAAALLDRLVAAFPTHPRFRHDRGVVHFLAGRPDRARADFLAALRLDPDLQESLESLEALGPAPP